MPAYLPPSKSDKEFQPGQVVAKRYQIESFLAEGGMGAIYIARDRHSQVRVAVKCLYKLYNNNEVVRTRFLDEARIQMMLQHPNIVRVYEIAELPTLAFVMEYVPGCTLEERLKESGPLEAQEVLSIMIPVLSGIGLAHGQGIIHRDLKPSNILLKQTPQGDEPKIMDFGVAKVNRTKDLTATGTTVGTLHYMSPEQILGSKTIDGRADIYSLGITLYKLCTGKVPFNAATEFALMMAQVKEAPTPPSVHNPHILSELERIILRAIAKRAEDRFQNIAEFTLALTNLKDAGGTATLETLSLPDFIIDYAMDADEVAVDRTQEVIMRSKHLYESGFFDRHEEEETPQQVAGFEDIDMTAQLSPLRLEQASEQDMDTYDLEHDRTLQEALRRAKTDSQAPLPPSKTTTNRAFKRSTLARIAQPQEPVAAILPPLIDPVPSTLPPRHSHTQDMPPRVVGYADTRDRTKPIGEIKVQEHLPLEEAVTLPLGLPDSSAEWSQSPGPMTQEQPHPDPVGRVLKVVLGVLMALVVGLMILILYQAFG